MEMAWGPLPLFPTKEQHPHGRTWKRIKLTGKDDDGDNDGYDDDDGDDDDDEDDEDDVGDPITVKMM